MISICIPARSEGPALLACLESILAQADCPPYEILICLTSEQRRAGEAVRRVLPGAVVGTVVDAPPAGARNELVKRARGDLLYFIDDDVVLAPDCLSRLAQLAAAHPAVDVFGGPNLTPKGSSEFERVQGAVLSSLIGAGPVRRRYGRHPGGPADERWFILCNLAIRTAAMRSFDPTLVCAEENALLSGMSAEGVAMHYDPALVVYHRRRADLRSFVAQMVKYGRGRGQAMRRDTGNFRVAYALPALLVADTVATPAGFALLGAAALAPLAAYLLVLGAGGLKVALTLRRPWSVPQAAVLILLMHAASGVGVWRGALGRAPHRAGRRRPTQVWVAAPEVPTLRTSGGSGSPAPGPRRAQP